MQNTEETMHSDLAEIGWTEEQWSRIVTTVTEEAQRARVAAQMLPVCGPELPTVVAVPNFTLTAIPNRAPPPSQRLAVDSEPTLHLTKIAVNVHLRSHEAADPDLKAALVMFRRAANQIARVEDALVFNGRPGNDLVPPSGIRNPDIYRVTGLGPVAGLFIPTPGPDRRSYRRIPLVLRSNTTSQGQPIVTAVVDLINDLETKGQLGPYACVLGQNLFHDVCDPTSNLVLPRDRILPFLQGPLLRSSAILPDYGVVLALSGSPVELVVASDIHVRFLQTSLEPRFVFRVSERVALRIKDDSAVGIMRKN